jgi:hypothetical protein
LVKVKVSLSLSIHRYYKFKDKDKQQKNIPACEALHELDEKGVKKLLCPFNDPKVCFTKSI